MRSSTALLSLARIGLAWIGLASSGLPLSGCTDPKGELEAYVDRTNGIRGVVPDGGHPLDDSSGTDAAVDVPPFDANLEITGTFLTSCLPSIAAGDASKSLLFYTEVAAAGGKLSFTNYALAKTATKMSKSETVGDPHGGKNLPIGADRTFTANIGTVHVPGTSQRIGASDLTLENIVYHGIVDSADRLCAELDGAVTSPIMVSLADPGDYCIFVRLADGANLPTVTSGGSTYVGFTAAEHHCP